MPVAKKTTTKKTASKKATKKTATKKTAPKKATKKTTARKPSTALAKGQIKILQLLAKSGKQLTRKQLITKGVEPTGLGGHIGLKDPDKRAIQEERDGRKSLLTLKLVKVQQQDVDGKDVLFYAISATGKQALASAS